MQPDWQSFLEQAGARISNGRVADFGRPSEELARADGDLIADLSHFGLMSVQGEEAQLFLQGQLTNDVRLVDGTRSQLTSHCTPKGRILALFRLFKHGESYVLRCPSELLSPMLKRMRMYLLRSKAVIEDTGSTLTCFGVAGPNAERLVSSALGSVPSAPDAAVYRDGITALRVDGVLPRFELYGEPARLRSIWTQLSLHTQPVGSSVWSLLDIRAGLPQVFATTSESFVPQMLNLHAIDGVSFKKGCYTGQEVVARMQYLGKLKRRMYLVHVESGDVPAPGEELFSTESESGQGTGKVVTAEPAPDGGYDLLAVIHIAAVERGAPIHLRDAQGPVLRIGELPYDVDELGGNQAQK
jgi:folate-binding protein YgfZ